MPLKWGLWAQNFKSFGKNFDFDPPLGIIWRFWSILADFSQINTRLYDFERSWLRFSEVPVFWNFVHELYNNIISLILSESANIMAQKSKIKVKIILKMGSSGHPESNKLIPKFWSPRLTPIWAFKSDQKLQRTSFIVK